MAPSRSEIATTDNTASITDRRRRKNLIWWNDDEDEGFLGEMEMAGFYIRMEEQGLLVAHVDRYETIQFTDILFMGS